MKTTVNINKLGVKMVAHRGLSGIERENTKSAFIAAANRSYYGIETDVHVNPDGEFIIMHDDSTKRVSGGKYSVNVEKVSYEKLADIILPDLDGSFDRSDIRIPKLSEYIRICKKYGKRSVLELKNPFVKEDVIRLVQEITDLGYIDGVTFISFSFNNCVILRELLPNAAIQWLTGEPISDEDVEKLIRYSLGLDIYYKHLDREKIEMLHAKGIEVNCWTCDDKNAAEQLAEMGVDYITSNILE
ncbi:MAG: hypothetical protein IKW68_03195 [Clostridia bacterium]|nr:hypothetical protein [Clostridia bacterium]